MKLADMEEYIRVVYGLLNGETLETDIEGKRRKIRFLNPDFGLINTRDPSACTSPPTARIRRRWPGSVPAWKTFISDVPGALAQLKLQPVGQAARLAADLYATAWACGCVRER